MSSPQTDTTLQHTKNTKDMSNVALMDIGEHCTFCGQIDFLPNKCKCSGVFCLQHKDPETHQCPKIDHVKKMARETIDTSHLPSAKTLFPDRSNFKVTLKTTETNPVTIATKMEKKEKNTGGGAFAKIKKLFEMRKQQRVKAPGAAKKLVDLSLVRSSAKGDPKVPVSERIYVWVQVVDDESKFDKIERNPVWVSRGWPLGRALDSIAMQLKLKNLNNRTTDQTQRLFLFREKKNDQGFEKLDTSGRCNLLTNGETLFVVRGTDDFAV